MILSLHSHVFGLLRRLPEKEIGADCRAENGDQRRKIGAFERDRRPKGGADRRPFRLTDHDGRGNVGEKGKGEPFQVRDVFSVWQRDLQDERHASQRQHVSPERPRQKQFGRCGHRADIGAEIENIREQQKRNHQIEDRRRKMPPHVGRNSLPRHATDAGADLLNDAHQRVGEQGDPQHAESESRAGLRIRGYPARIVIGCARDEAGAQLQEHAPES